MFRKKIVGALLAGVVLAGSLQTTVFAASGDYVDKVFSFYVDSTQRTDSYTKYTSSSVYLYVTESDTGFAKVQTEGYIGGKWVNKTVNNYAVVERGCKRRIRNTVLESNNNTATSVRLCFPVYLSYTPVGGFWSPDCLGSYEAAN